MSFILKMAWRDSRRNRGRLILFVSAIAVGISALTAVRSFRDNLARDVETEAQTLLGADLVIEGNVPMPDTLRNRMEAVPGVQMAQIDNLLTMVYFPRTESTRLTMVRALEGAYPYYGTWNSMPEDAWKTYRTGAKTLVEHSLFLQFGLQTGDTVRIGKASFTLEGDLLARPGRARVGSDIAPVAFIPMAWLEATQLVQPGSRVWYQYFFKFPEGTNVDAYVKTLDKAIESAHLNWDTVASNKRKIGKAFDNFTTFLNLTGFVALLLGCIGVAGAVQLYLKSKMPIVAILRCLGSSARKAFLVYLVQVSVVSLIGVGIGAVSGALIQKVLPWMMRDFLPIENLHTDISPSVIAQNVLWGLILAILFSLVPLMGILKTAPLRTLRADYADEPKEHTGTLWVIYSLIFVVMLGFTRLLVGSWFQSAYFAGGIILAIAVLYGLAWVLTVALRRYFPRSWPYVWRQGIANLFRPENQTLVLVVTIGLGAMLLSTLMLTQQFLLQQVAFTGRGKQANMILFDIQNSDRDSVAAMVRVHEMPLIQQVSVVTTRLESIDGRTKMQDMADSTRALEKWVWDREYRVSFRDTLIDTEKIVEGVWIGHAEPGKPVPISLSEEISKRMKAKIGARLVFNVQGMHMETEVKSIRRLDLTRMQTNFPVLFPAGVLEMAPQFHVIVSRVSDANQSAKFQEELVRKYPGISAIDLTQILKSLDDVLGKLAFVIRFMAMFSIITGFLVLLSSIYQGKYARIRESILLRTLGASRMQIRWIIAIEYFLLGALACITGIGLSLAGAWALAKFVFELPFSPDLWHLAGTFFSISGLTVLIGWLNSRDVVRKTPLEVLREES
ncbi:MAG: FtsX-like permease family protein [Bacteroidetes bacterium]|nr:FtsX-like permease family protein [Bacteroidota bacterium]